jgi:hypothetical protein
MANGQWPMARRPKGAAYFLPRTNLYGERLVFKVDVAPALEPAAADHSRGRPRPRAGRRGAARSATWAAAPSGWWSTDAVDRNIARFRIDEAKKASAAGNKDVCREAAKVAVAISQGLPKFRKELVAKDGWATGYTYETRFDGTLSEEQLFARLAEYGEEAKGLFKTCGGTELKFSAAEELTFKEGAPSVAASAPEQPWLWTSVSDGETYDFDVVCPDGSQTNGSASGAGRGGFGEAPGYKGCRVKVRSTGHQSAPLNGKEQTCTFAGGSVPAGDQRGPVLTLVPR